MSEYAEKILLFSDRIKSWQSGSKIVPVTMDIELTYRCNHSCPWCAYSNLLQTDGSLLPFDIVSHCLDWASEHGVSSIIYSGGGEPTLHPKFREIMAATDKRELDFAIFTNGSTLAHLAYEIPFRCRYLRISLDAATQSVHEELHGSNPASFQQLQAALQRLRSVNTEIVIGLSYVVTEANCRQAPQFYELAKSWDVNHVFFKREISLPSFPAGFDISWIEGLEASRPAVFVRDPSPFSGHKTERCHTSPLKAVVDANGKVYICCARRGKEDVLGDLRESSFEDIWGSTRHRAVWSGINVRQCPDCRMRRYNELTEIHLKNEALVGFV